MTDRFPFPVPRFPALLLLLLAILGASEAPPPEVQQVERGLRPPVLLKGDKTWTIEERMRLHHVPAVSIAVFAEGRILWAKAYGLADADALSPATDATLFQAASISKPVTAMAALKKVEQGKLSLDRNINDFLKSWKLPENDFTKKAPVTLAELLSHSGGTTVRGFPGYAAGRAVPTLIQVLDGAPPANTAAIRVNALPGKAFSYSGGGYTIVQQALMDVEGKPYPQILAETVLKPLGMAESTYEQPLPPELLKSAAAGHDKQGRPIPGKRHTYPEMAAAGLWTTPSDLARFAVGLERALEGRPGSLLSKEMAAKMVTPGLGDVGLGLVVENHGPAKYFAHGGSNEGFRCQLVAHRERGYGAAVMTNSDSGGEIIPEVLRAIAAAYRWEGYRSDPIEPAKLDAAALAARAGRYQLSTDEILTLTPKGERLEGRVSLMKGFELIPLSADAFLRTDADVRYKFAKDSSGRDEVVIEPEQGEKGTGRRVAETVRVPAEDLEAGKLDAAVAGYRRLRDANPADPSVAEGRLNSLGYALLARDEFKAAIAVFQLNTQLYPDSANTYDSLAEAHMNKGDKKQAIALYRKALETLARDKSSEETKEGVRASATEKLKQLGVENP
ncbi:MAG TPA: serine hydrolase [Thermoanaerobaculia bacterium]|nr:serine hydrolase [Thermoanaerobaculia bacterium]